QPKDVTGTYFLRLRLRDAAGRGLSSNVYWLSTQEDVLDWKDTKWYYTPTKTHADLTGLAKLSPTTLTARVRFDDRAPEGRATVSVQNPGKALAFQVRLKLVDPETGAEILPVYWDDNYLALFPGETQEIAVSYPRGAKPAHPALEADAWNVPSAR